MLYWLFPIVGLCVVIVILCLKNGVNFIQSLILSIFVTVSGWLIAPTLVNIPFEESFYNRLTNINFMLYEMNGFAYSFTSSLLLCVVLYYLQISLSPNRGFSSNTVFKKYDIFAQDADDLYVVAGDLSFLLNSKSQKEKFKSLGSRCKIICKRAENTQTYALYMELHKSNVDIRVFNENIYEPLLRARGQIKTSTRGVSDTLFMEKGTNDKYYEIVLKNQFLIDAIREKVVILHGKCKNPVIHAIAIDWTSICLNKDSYKEFWKFLQDRFGLNCNNDFKSNTQSAILKKNDESIFDLINKKVEKSESKRISLNSADKNEIIIKWNATLEGNNLQNTDKLNEIRQSAIACKLDLFFCADLDNTRIEFLSQKGVLLSYTSCHMVSCKLGACIQSTDYFYKFKNHLSEQGPKKYLTESAVLFISNNSAHIDLAKKSGFQAVAFNDINMLEDVIL